MTFSPSQLLVQTFQCLSYPTPCQPSMSFHWRASRRRVQQMAPPPPPPLMAILRSDSTTAWTTNSYPSTAPSWQRSWLAWWPSSSSRGEDRKQAKLVPDLSWYLQIHMVEINPITFWISRVSYLMGSSLWMRAHCCLVGNNMAWLFLSHRKPKLFYVIPTKAAKKSLILNVQYGYLTNCDMGRSVLESVHLNTALQEGQSTRWQQHF